jgi:hypothetical protein
VFAKHVFSPVGDLAEKGPTNLENKLGQFAFKNSLSPTAYNIPTKAANYFPTMARAGAEQGLQGTGIELANGGNVMDIAKEGLINAGQGALFGGALKGLGDLGHSAFKTNTTIDRQQLSKPNGILKPLESTKGKGQYNINTQNGVNIISTLTKSTKGQGNTLIPSFVNNSRKGANKNILIPTLPTNTPQDIRAKDIEFSKIKQFAANKIPATLADKVQAVQHIQLLLNPKTMLRNVYGNVIMGGLENIKDIPGSMLDKAVSLKTGQRTTLLPSFEGLKTQAQGLIEGAKNIM